jgi:hypothetical protein
MFKRKWTLLPGESGIFNRLNNGGAGGGGG